MLSDTVLSQLLFVGVSWALAGQASTTPNAFSVAPSTTWYGDDGQWSAVSVRLGSPPQWIDVLVSTATSETWAVSPGGCDGTSICQLDRGGLFDYQKSSTWQYKGAFELGPGFKGDAVYGLDILEFGASGVSMNNSIIGSINMTTYWLGFLGLGNIPGSFNNAVVSSPIGGLAAAGSVPSQSYGFTAGAIYQQKGDPASLTLGGYDANRFIPHNISFQLNPFKQPNAFLNSISVASHTPAGKAQAWSSNPLQLLSKVDGVSVTIDSSTPFLWLPESTCNSFAQALGLTYNNTLDLYTFEGSASTHDDLRSWNLNFTFVLSDTDSPSQLVNITLPYAAFDLQLSYPYIPNSSYTDPNVYYFPLRQTSNDSQYVIGRAFLQEAYIITDYDRNNFSIYQAVHNPNPLGNISLVNIYMPSSSPTTSPSASATPPSQTARSSGLSTPAIIGIAIGVFVVLFIPSLILFLRYRSRRPPPEPKDLNPDKKTHPVSTPSLTFFLSPASEVDGRPLAKSTVPQPVAQVPGLYELYGNPTRPAPESELDGHSLDSPRRDWGDVRARGQDPESQKFLRLADTSLPSQKYRPSMRVRHDTSAGEGPSS